MYYLRKKPLLDLPGELTAIWSCIKDGCNGWTRDNFVFIRPATCIQCGNPTEKSEKMQSNVDNTSPDQTKW
ncbi:cold-inducible protein YdjO-related protein [Paenibacillus sp. FSL L8-0340]|uniref:cold-inducible protein YdjO-related protein n=1 Tax=Paenibacillus sp. FSL L8-0340 TaxID=2954685 RepID=UPI003157FA2D